MENAQRTSFFLEGGKCGICVLPAEGESSGLAGGGYPSDRDDNNGYDDMEGLFSYVSEGVCTSYRGASAG